MASTSWGKSPKITLRLSPADYEALQILKEEGEITSVSEFVREDVGLADELEEYIDDGHVVIDGKEIPITEPDGLGKERDVQDPQSPKGAGAVRANGGRYDACRE